VRVWALGEHAKLDARLFDERLARALAIRAALFPGDATTAYRILNGEGDRTPGFVLDRYGDVAVLRLDGAGARAVAAELTTGTEARLRGAGITTLLERESVRGEQPVVRVRFGPERPSVQVREHGVPFVVDLLHGQKTGAFLDQRENRKRIGDLVGTRARAGLGTRVLNLFSYTGGFSLRAALAGAVVTSVDVAAKAHATAQESFRLAGVDPRGHVFAAADAFAFLESAKKRGERWDVVISDPPSFAPSEKAKPRALTAYRALHRACADVLSEGGAFVAASCSSHVGTEDFLTTLDDAALGRGDLRVLEIHGAPADHPSLATFPEGRYLKLVVLA
jgi:23S rRNA (cytosine1962-C5)-methyltransferase